MRKIILLLLFPFLMLAQSEKRLALVIGNANYDEGKLNNPVNDAILISETLEKLNFDVILGTDISNEKEFVDLIREFGNKRESYDVGFVFYAGHAVQVDNQNYLLPTKAEFNDKFDVVDNGVSAQVIMRYLTDKTDQVNVFILDACRDNPFEHNWNGKSRSVGGGDGLAKMQATGTLIAFSTTAGKTSPDGVGKNSIYSQSLAKNFLLVNTTIDQVFRNVRSEVLELTNGVQMTEEATQLTGEPFYLTRKHDYNKIEVNQLIKQSSKDFKDGNIKEALEGYTILEIYLKSNSENLEESTKKNLKSIYVNMGRIYLQLYASEPDAYYESEREKNIELDQWTEDVYYELLNEYEALQEKYLKNAANAFLKAKSLFDVENLKKKKEIELYSESLYKYLRSQSYLDYAKRGIDESTFIEYINQLNDFNEKHFGVDNYRTACSHYLKALFIKDLDPADSYYNFVKSSQIFSSSTFSQEDLINYAFSFNPVFPYKWSVMTFNDILEGALDENNRISPGKLKDVTKYIKKNIDNDIENLYHTNKSIVSEGVELAEKTNSDLDGMIITAITFHHMFPIVFVDADLELHNESFNLTIEYRNKTLNSESSYRDSIRVIMNNATSYNNLYLEYTDRGLTDSLSSINNTIYDLHQNAFYMALANQDGSAAIFTLNGFLTEYYYNNNDDDLYLYEDLKTRLSQVNVLFLKTMQENRKKDLDDVDFLTEYIQWMDLLYEDNVLQTIELDNYTKQKELYQVLFSD